MSESFDCIVMGGGPGGSTAAALVAQAGYKTVLLEREKFPRFHIGESLMPDTYFVFERLGVLEKMKSSSFVKKYSIQFVSHSGRESAPFYFQDHDSRECSQTWQVERGKFDQMLMENAAEKGADVREETRVLEVLFADGRAKGVKIQTTDGAVREIYAPVVVDATGQQALIAGALGIRRVNPHLRKAAIWNYYRGARRDPGPNGGATLVLHTEPRDAWFWYIPLSDDITSVGVVGDNDYLLKGRGTPEQVFHEEVGFCRALAERLADAELVDKYRVAKEFSYTTERPAGDGWVLVGDAWGFIDPIYSSGVFLALKSGELAADAIIAGLASGDTSAAQLGGWAEDFAVGASLIRRLANVFYSKEFSFSRFIRRFPEHRDGLTDLLIGRVFSPEAGRVFDDLDPMAGQAAQASMTEPSR